MVGWIMDMLHWDAEAFERLGFAKYIVVAIFFIISLLGIFSIPFWIILITGVSLRSFQEVPVGVIGETFESDVRQAFDPLLDAIMQTLRDRRATNPKDKSYAMYGILESLAFVSRNSIAASLRAESTMSYWWTCYDGAPLQSRCI
jgi:hypothetical protein